MRYIRREFALAEDCVRIADQNKGPEKVIPDRPLTPIVFILVAAAYCVAGRIALMLAIPTGYAMAFWPSAGIALAAVLMYGPRVWPAIWVGSLTLILWNNVDALLAGQAVFVFVGIMIGLGASLQAVVSAWLLRLFRGWPSLLESGRCVARLLLIGGPLGCLVSATIGVMTMFACGLTDARDLPSSWMNWWVGDAIGVLTVTPLTLIWAGALGDAWRRRAVAVTAPLVVALFVVLAAFAFATRSEQARIESEFNKTVVSIEATVAHSLSEMLEVLAGVQSLYVSSKNVEREEFQAFTRRPLRRHPDLLALSWNEYVTHERRSSFENEPGMPDGLPITERDANGNLVRAGSRDDYVVVKYIEPVATNREALGFDVASSPSRREAIDHARDTGMPTATRRLQLVQSDQPETGLLVFAPVYSGVEIPQTVEGRRNSIVGYAVGVLLARQFFAATITDLQPHLENISLQLYDEADGDTGPALADWGVREDEQQTPLSAERSMPFAGRVWRLSIKAGPEYVKKNRAAGLPVALAIGLMLSGLLGAFNLVLTSHERREALRAARDPLTGLANRVEFERRLANSLRSARQEGAQHALAFCDLDQFKVINDTAGHIAGDEMLKQVPQLFSQELRTRDTVARVGGDEFGILLEHCPLDTAAVIGERICAALHDFRFRWNDQVFQVGISIGLVAITADTAGTIEAMSRADLACYTAKELGRNRVYVDGDPDALGQPRRTELQRAADIRRMRALTGLRTAK